jgi:hypothetical protein
MLPRDETPPQTRRRHGESFQNGFSTGIKALSRGSMRRMSPVQPKNLKTLDDLLAQANFNCDLLSAGLRVKMSLYVFSCRWT